MMASVSVISIIIIGCIIMQGISWHALIDAPDSDPIATTALGTSSVFMVYRKRVSWNEARKACENTVGRLAVLPKLDDAVSLVNFVKTISTPFTDEYDHAVKKYEFGMDRRYWIGLTDLAQEGEWIWMDSGAKLEYDYWYPSQPDHVASGQFEHCVVLWNPGYNYGDTHTFNDEDCLHKHYFICEKTSRTLQSPLKPPAGTPAATPPAGAPAAAPPGGVPAAAPPGGAPAATPPAGAPAATPPGGAPAATPSVGAPAAPPPGETPAATPPVGAPAAPPPGETPAATPPSEAPTATTPGESPAATPDVPLVPPGTVPASPSGRSMRMVRPSENSPSTPFHYHHKGRKMASISAKHLSKLKSAKNSDRVNEVE